MSPRRAPEPVTSMERLEAIVRRVPEAQRVDIEAWGDEPTFRVKLVDAR